MLNEEEQKIIKNDILFQIDMQLYDEFNDKLATMNDHLGDIYSLRDIEEVEQAEKDKEIKLLREAIKTLQKELNQEREKEGEINMDNENIEDKLKRLNANDIKAINGFIDFLNGATNSNMVKLDAPAKFDAEEQRDNKDIRR